MRFKDVQIEMAHGAGGKASRRLVEGLIAPLLSNATLDELGDAAVLPFGAGRLATTADSFVVRPLRFPGGSIGELAVNGTVNDLAVSGARPLALLATFILEAGLSTQTLREELEALAAAARRAGVSVIGGDTKVVEHGKADGMYISTFGFGTVDERALLAAGNVRPGDRVLVSGSVGDHGITVLLARGELDLEAQLESDTRPLTELAFALIDACGDGLRWMRDPTRGGVATALNELARACGHAVLIEEDSVPLRSEVRGACEILGLDPLHIANEGCLLAIVAPQSAGAALEVLQRTPGGERAADIGEIREAPERTVLGRNAYGGTRTIDMLVGDPLPRIC